MTPDDRLEELIKEAVEQLNEDIDRRQWTSALFLLPSITRVLQRQKQREERDRRKKQREERDRRINVWVNRKHRYKHAEIFRRVVYGFEPCSKIAQEVSCSATTIADRVKEMARAKGCPPDWLFIGDIRVWFDRQKEGYR